MEKKRKGRGGAWAARILLWCFSAAMAGLLACGSGSADRISEDRKRIVEDYAELILLQDQDSASYDRVLEEVKEYLKEQTPEQKARALSAIGETTEKMAELTASYSPHQSDSGFEKLLEENGISPVEYHMNADGRYQMLSLYMQDMLFLKYYVENADADEIAMEELKLVCERYLEDQRDLRGYGFTGVNYWFAGWEEKETAYIKETVLDRFQSFSAENPVWEEERGAVELRMEMYLDRMEARLDEFAGELGRKREQLYELEKELEEEFLESRQD